MLMLPIFLLQCGTNATSEAFDLGSIKGDIYTNDYFNCQIELPNNWIPQSKEQTDRLANLGKELIVGENEELKAVIKASEVNTVNLVTVFQYEIGSAVEFNPSMVIMAENLATSPGIKNGGDYLFHARRFLQQSQTAYEYLSDSFEEEIINGTVFHKMNANRSFMGLDIKQVYYSTTQRGFSFNVIVSYVNDEQKNVLSESVHSLTFEG